MAMTKPFFSFKGARVILAAFGCTLSNKDGEYKVRIKGSKRGMGYYTDDIDDAVREVVQ